LTSNSEDPHRLGISGKFFAIAGKHVLLRGTTYGSFEPDSSGKEYVNVEMLHRDFAEMQKQGFNCLRIPHRIPNRMLLDIAQQYDLKVMISLGCEQYIGYLADTAKKFDIFGHMKSEVDAVKGHPSIFCYSLGNEMQPSFVRWFGPRKIEAFLRELTVQLRSWDPFCLVTYVNFPTTEYLQLPFLDFLSFNIYLENRSKYADYISRLQNIAGDRPLLLAEVGVDSESRGLEKQAEELDWLIDESLRSGCAGVFIFSWTDEWYVRRPITEWAFGLTDWTRQPKPALSTVSKAFKGYPLRLKEEWPFISVVVCSFNGSATLPKTLDALTRMNYPRYEVIVIDDGSTDQTPTIAQGYPVELISTPNQGLSAARNLGWQLAQGNIIAYLDDDAFPPADWLFFIAIAFDAPECAAAGGPNFPPLGRSIQADAIALAPGGPKAVLISDTEAEHLPGCNLCIRRSALEELGGFDPRFRAAGDDVDICWRILDRGWSIRYHASAFVWHHARSTIKALWKQQAGYGKAESLLQGKWPEKYNETGQTSWRGRIYGSSVMKPLFLRSRVYHGEWGRAPFQALHYKSSSFLADCTLMPEFYLLIIFFFILGLSGLLWPPLFIFAGFSLLGLVVLLSNILVHVRQTQFHLSSFARTRPLALASLTALLYILQPLARLHGRIRYRVLPWWKKDFAFFWPWIWGFSYWSDAAIPADQRLLYMEHKIQGTGFFDRRSGLFDRWDLQVKGGFFGKARIYFACENHGSSQMLRASVIPFVRRRALVLLVLFILSGLLASKNGAFEAATVFLVFFAAVFVLSMINCALACGVSRKAVLESFLCKRT